MPTPDQTRLTLSRSMTGMEPASLADQRRDIAIEQAVNRLPFFVEYDRQFLYPTGTTTLTSTSTIDMDFLDGLWYVDFDKFETWTDVKVRFAMSGYASTASLLSIGAYVTDQADIETAIGLITRHYFNTANEHHYFGGETRLEGLLPGQYRLTFEWNISAGTFRHDTNDVVYSSVTEMIPIPSVGE
jgi:hypothetical protein